MSLPQATSHNCYTGTQQLNSSIIRTLRQQAHSLHVADFPQQSGKTTIEAQKSKHVAICCNHKQMSTNKVVSSKSECILGLASDNTTERRTLRLSWYDVFK